MSTGHGPLWRVDGPLPIPSQYGLLQAARSPLVRIIPDEDASGVERWANGIEVYPYPPSHGHGFDSCSVYGSNPGSKEEGDSIDLPQYDALTVYLAETCSSFGIGNQEAFRARAVAALAAVEGRVVERELMCGDVFPGQPHLADGEGQFPILNDVTTVTDGVALLEDVIGDSGRAGLLHVSPAVATAMAQNYLLDNTGGILRTVGNGTVVIAGQGYNNADGNICAPAGHPSPGQTEAWIYATGPIDVRRTDVVMLPGELSQALDRENNVVTYRAERYYLADWDTQLQAAVLVDRCTDTCAGG